MTIADQITRLNNAKAAIKQSIENKGVAVSDTALLDEYPALIDSIEVGSGGEGGGDPLYEDLFNQRTSNGTSMSHLFYNCTSSELDLSNLNTDNVTIMDRMFNNCYSLITLNLSNWNTSKVTDMAYMFASDNLLTEIIGIDNFNTGNVTNIEGMFYYCYNLTSIDVSNFDTSNAINMNNVFSCCNGLLSLDLSNWDTSNATSIGGMFSYMQSPYLTTLDLSSFNTKKVTSVDYMFCWCNMLQELDIRNFELVHEDGTEVTISSMLEGCDSLHTLRLDNCSNATISKIINESGMPQEQAYINGEYVTRKIYCKAENTGDLSLPPGWRWETV